MSANRMPFDEAKKLLTVSSIPKSVKQQLAYFLDKHHGSNWECLADKLGIAPHEIEWVKNTVFNCPSGSTTFRLFQTFLYEREISLETFVEALEAIKNLASVKALTDGYANGAFDSTLKHLSSNGCAVNTNFPNGQCHASISKSCKSFDYYHRSPSPFLHSGNNYECPGHSQRGIEYESLRKVSLPDGPFLSSGGSSTYGSMDGNIGDSISYTKLDSDPSLETSYRSYERQVPFMEALFRAENQLPSINDTPIRAGELPNLSKNGPARAEGDVKGEPRGCRNGFRCAEKLEENGAGCGCHQAYDQRTCANWHCVAGRQIKIKHEAECEPWEACAGQNHAHFTQAERMSLPRPTFEGVKREPLEDPDSKVPNPGKNLCTKENVVEKGDISCCCLTNSNFCAKIALSKADPTSDSFRHARDNVVQYPLGKRITHPVLKEDIDDKDTKKNPDGTNPIRNTGSSYGVVQQSPFKKDSRSIRVFVTYADDSKKHMKHVMQLCECLKKNSFSVSLDVRESMLLSQDRIGWYDKRFKVADCVLVLISPKYFQDVMEPERSRKAPDDDLALNTLYIHRCMQAEYMENKCINKRFIPVIMPGASKNHVPVWLQNTTKYIWPDQYKNLFFYMMYPEHAVTQFVLRERSAKMPTVQQTNN